MLPTTYPFDSSCAGRAGLSSRHKWGVDGATSGRVGLVDTLAGSEEVPSRVIFPQMMFHPLPVCLCPVIDWQDATDQ